MQSSDTQNPGAQNPGAQNQEEQIKQTATSPHETLQSASSLPPPPLPASSSGIVTDDANTIPLEIDSDRLEALAEFSAGAGHEINNPLATIIGRVQMLLRDEENLGRRQTLQTIGAQALRVRDMMSDVMLFARPPKPKFDPVSPIDCCKTAIEKITPDANLRGVQIEWKENCHQTIPQIAADETQFLVVVTELLSNAVIASPDEGTICVMTTIDEKTKQFVLEIHDQGVGFSETEQRHLFDPFFSGRQAGRGLGFGLSKCWRIITNHQGEIAVESNHQNQTIVSVRWSLVADNVANNVANDVAGNLS